MKRKKISNKEQGMLNDEGRIMNKEQGKLNFEVKMQDSAKLGGRIRAIAFF